MGYGGPAFRVFRERVGVRDCQGKMLNNPDCRLNTTKGSSGGSRGYVDEICFVNIIRISLDKPLGLWYNGRVEKSVFTETHMALRHITSKWIGFKFVVEFLDHVENESTTALIQATGRLISIEPYFIRLRAWELIPKADPSSQTEWCIIRSTIRNMTRLEEVGEIYRG